MTATTTSTAPQTARIGWSHRLLVVAISSATLLVTGWAGVQVHAVEQRLDRVAQQTPHTPVRQIERSEQMRADETTSVETHDRHRFANQASLSGRPTPRDLLAIEYSELRRFRNRASAAVLPALDAEIERLRAALVPPAAEDA